MPSVEPRLRLCAKADFDWILTHLEEFWGNDRTAAFHHPMFLHEFGNTAFVAEIEGELAGYLFGFLSQAGPVAYVHLVGIRKRFQRQGLARTLYQHFQDVAASHGCRSLKAITTPENRQSIAFHLALGMEPEGLPNPEGIAVVRDYSGPGLDRVVFIRSL